MKRQAKPANQAHLLPGAFYLILLVAVCAVPVLLAQSRGHAGPRSVTKPRVAAIAVKDGGPAHPHNFLTVTNLNDSGPGSLRAALAMANHGDAINFDSSLNGGTISLISGELLVDKDVSIAGPGPNQLTVQRDRVRQIFESSTSAAVGRSPFQA